MNEGLSIGDVVTFCNEQQGWRHNALVIDFHNNGFIALVHVVESFGRRLPQVELNVPWTTPDADGRYYVVEVKS